MVKIKKKIILVLLLVAIMLITTVPTFATKVNEKQWARKLGFGDLIKNIFSRVGKIIKDIIDRLRGGGKEPPLVEEIIGEFNSTALENFGKVSIKSLKGIDEALYYTVIFKYSDGESEDVVGPIGIEESTTEIFYNGEFPVTIEIYGENIDNPIYIFEDIYLELSE